MGNCFSQKDNIVHATNGYKEVIEKDEIIESFLNDDIIERNSMFAFLYYFENKEENPGYEGLINKELIDKQLIKPSGQKGAEAFYTLN